MESDNAKAVIKAAKKGDVTTLKKLIDKDRKLLAARDKDGSTPLHCAAWKGHLEVAQYLLDAGAEIDVHNQNTHWGSTPLHAAAHADHRDVAEFLIARGARVNTRNLNNRTPLAETQIHNAKHVAELLKKHGGK